MEKMIEKGDFGNHPAVLAIEFLFLFLILKIYFYIINSFKNILKLLLIFKLNLFFSYNNCLLVNHFVNNHKQYFIVHFT